MFPERFTSIRGLDSAVLSSLLSQARRIKAGPESFASVLKGKTILQFFVENSTRTRLSFEAATRKLGGVNLSFSTATSSLSKGETLADTVNVIRQYGVDGIVVRHSSMGAPGFLSDVTGLPVINAGDGAHEHPTQALLDAFTLGEHWSADFRNPGCFRGRKIMILGDLRHSRVARSNIHLMSALGAEIHLCAPATLMIRDADLFPSLVRHSFPDAILPEMDAVMTLRIQTERQSQGVIPSLAEYREFWGLSVDRAKRLKQGAVILHPGPVNRGVEIDPEVADSGASLILKQVENGVYARMAVLASVVGRMDS
jgi:aspartate carbamoyltransferase catalytic subunit